jgi:hypothetical protein
VGNAEKERKRKKERKNKTYPSKAHPLLTYFF